jgi:hypothetical protein
MNTLRILAERAIREIVGGDIPSDCPYDMDYAMETWRDVMRSDHKMELFTRRHGDSDDKSPVPQYIATYKVAVEKDLAVSQLRVYAKLPDYFMTIKYNRGIWTVSEEKQSLTPMIRTMHPHVTSRLSHQHELEGESYIYYVEGMNVFWMRDILKDKITHVLIKLIIAAPSMYGPDDILPIIPDNVDAMMEKVKLKIVNKYQQQDRIADGNPNLRATNEQSK